MKRTINILYLIFALGFITTLSLSPYLGSPIIKAIPALLLAIQVIIHEGFKGPFRWLFIGFLFSALGDIFLEVDNAKFFVHGLTSFLIAHVFYSLAFLIKKKLVLNYKWIALLMITYSFAMVFILSPKLGALFIPVTLYISVITFMGILSCGFIQAAPLVTIGACLFILSDSIIAINKFLIPFPIAGFAIMVTYYLANFFIGYGYLNNRLKSH